MPSMEGPEHSIGGDGVGMSGDGLLGSSSDALTSSITNQGMIGAAAMSEMLGLLSFRPDPLSRGSGQSRHITEILDATFLTCAASGLRTVAEEENDIVQCSLKEIVKNMYVGSYSLSLFRILLRIWFSASVAVPHADGPPK